MIPQEKEELAEADKSGLQSRDPLTETDQLLTAISDLQDSEKGDCRRGLPRHSVQLGTVRK